MYKVLNEAYLQGCHRQNSYNRARPGGHPGTGDLIVIAAKYHIRQGDYEEIDSHQHIGYCKRIIRIPYHTHVIQ